VFDNCTYFDYSSQDNIAQFMHAIGNNINLSTQNYRLNVTT